jgi:putative thioredoxin
MAIDVTDDTFETEVLARSDELPVVVDLWAEWCGPCRTLGPIIEKVVAETGGKVVLAKIDVDANPKASATFQVQSIPAVYALKDRKVVNGFIGAQPEQAVRDFVQTLLPTEEESEVAALVAKGDETSLRQALELEPDNEDAIVKLAELLVENGASDDALALLERIPETPEIRRVAARARIKAEGGDDPLEGIEAKLDALLARVKGDDEARQAFVDLLELLGPDDPRTATYRKALTAQLF